MKMLQVMLKMLPFLLLMLLLIVLAPSQNKNVSQNLLKVLADSREQYEQASPTNKINFPKAHWPHKSYRHEWWYLTANLTSASGQHFATQWTLFRTAINNHHWYFAHAALADTQQHLAEFREAREELGNVKIINNPFSAVIDDWAWRSSAELLPAQLNYGSPRYTLENINLEFKNGQDKNTQQKNWQAKLFLSTTKPFYLQGNQGFSAKHHSENIASHYYSQPFIDVSGEIYWQGAWQTVTGSAWFDREWGSAMLAEDQQGWDWFSLRLDKDQALMIYRIRSNQQNFVYGHLMHSNGTSKTLSASDIELKSAAIGKSLYPQGFNIKVEQLGIDININILNDKQVMRFGIEYFEGMVTFNGSHAGEGFVEMTGYN